MVDATPLEENDAAPEANLDAVRDWLRRGSHNDKQTLTLLARCLVRLRFVYINDEEMR